MLVKLITTNKQLSLAEFQFILMVDSVTICNRLSFYSFVAEIRIWRLSEINELSMVINVSIAVAVM